MTFIDMMERILSHEGGFTLNPLDRGNYANGILRGTKYGISARSYPNVDIKNLTRSQALAIYRRDFYEPLKPSIMTGATVFQLLDFAVNSGVRRANISLQKAVGAAPDGIIGPVTMLAVANTPDHKITTLILADRLDYMSSLSAWKTFNKGWARRIATNLRYAADEL